MESWSDGIMEWWNDEKTEGRNGGAFGRRSTTPLLQYSVLFVC